MTDTDSSLGESHKCQLCEKVFKDQATLNIHMMKHNDDNLNTQKNNLQSSLQCPTVERLYKYDEWCKAFKHKRSFRPNIILHTEDCRYKCNNCNKVLVGKHNLQMHMSTHTTDKPYKCDECGDTFTQKCNLQAHVILHTGEQPCKCNMCNKVFTDKSNDSEDKPYNCNECDKTIVNKSNLEMHMSTRSADNPSKCRSVPPPSQRPTVKRLYKCDICGKVYKHKCLIRKHLMLHKNEDGPYMCKQCDKRFRQKDHLETHTKTHYTNVMNLLQHFTGKMPSNTHEDSQPVA